MATQTLNQLVAQMIGGRYIRAKYWRRAIDQNKLIRQKFELQEEFVKRFKEFTLAANKAHKAGANTFKFEGQTFQPRSALRTAASVNNRSHSEFGRANFKQQAYTLKKLFPEIAEGQELGHKNISVLRASLSATLSAMDKGDPRRDSVKALYFVAKEIDSLTEKGEDAWDTILDKLENSINSGYNVKSQYTKDVHLLTGIKGTLELEFEPKDINQFKGRLAGMVGDLFRKVVTDASFDLTSSPGFENIANLKGSPSIIEELTEQSLAMIDPKKKIKGRVRTKAKSSVKQMTGGRTKIKRVKKSKAKAPVAGRTKGVSSSPLEMLGILNQQLPKVVANNMGSPRLNYVSGRFASSVNVTDITQTAKGFPSIGYSYRRNPYEVFEQDPNRDPRKIIDLSIREIAAQFAIGRFYTRRV